MFEEINILNAHEKYKARFNRVAEKHQEKLDGLKNESQLFSPELLLRPVFLEELSRYSNFLLSACKEYLGDYESDLDGFLQLREVINQSVTIENEDILLKGINIEISKLFDAKKRKKYYEERKIEETKSIQWARKNNQDIYLKYNKMSIADLENELKNNYISFSDKDIIKNVIGNKKSNAEIDDHNKKTNNFRSFIKKETTEALKNMMKNEDFSKDEITIIRFELRERYGIL